MQSAPTEASQTATSVDSSQDPSTSSHHGLQDPEQQASDGLSRQETVRAPHEPAPDDADALSVSSGGTSRGRQLDARRISNRTDSSQESSPGSRIDEYERAHTKVYKQSHGMMFQVVPTKDGQIAGVSVEEFPNGEHEAALQKMMLTVR